MYSAVDQLNEPSFVPESFSDRSVFIFFFSGIGTDCSVTPTRHGSSHSLIQTTNFVYPIIDDPYSMGKISCAHALSDLYALGVTECDNILMLLGVSQKLTEKERDVVIPLIIKGFKVSVRT